MRMRELLRLVWQNITQNKSKTVLTSIGIIVGAATIVMVIAIGKGGKMDVEDQFRNLNAGAIDISCQAEQQKKNNSGRAQFGGGMMPGGGRPSDGGAYSGRGGNSGGGMPSGGMQPGGGMSDGEMPNGGGMPDGEMPNGGGMPDGEMPPGGRMPDGEMPNGGGMPDGEMPNGGGMPDGEMSNGEGTSSDGERPSGGGKSSDGAGTSDSGKSSDKASSDAENSSGDNNASGDGESHSRSSTGTGRQGGRAYGASGVNNADAEWVTLASDDTEYLLENMQGISEGTISYTTRTSVDGGDLEEAAVYTIAGVQENYASISNLKLSAGEFISAESNENKEKSCVLGANAAEEIFGSAIDAYGSILYIDQRIYVVDGVLEAMGSVASGISPDDAIFIPYATGIKYLVGEEVRPTLTILAQDVEQTEEIIAEAQSLLEERYPNSAFTFSDAGSKMEAAEASNRILTMLLAAMALLVFFVGGIGIMNVLFVSVKERTNEIGILKAIGCSRANILTEFLLEAAAISLIGGILGSLASLAVTPVVRTFDIRVELSVPAFAAALFFAVVTGTLFGFYPAYKASKLVPVDALGAE